MSVREKEPRACRRAGGARGTTGPRLAPCHPASPGPSAESVTGRPARTALALLLAGAFGTLPAAAHDVWLEPSSFRPRVDTPVAVRILVGESFRGETVPRDRSRIVRFVARGAGGDEELGGIDGSSPAGYFRPAAAGPYVLGYLSHHAFLELPAAKFEGYLREEGLERIVAQRAAGGESERGAREAYSRCAKALLIAVGGEGEAAESAPGGDLAQRPLGCPLELLAETLPAAPAGGASTFRLTFRDAPLEGALVQALAAENPGRALAARTDAAGRVRFALDRGGAWLVKAVHMERAPAAVAADWESWWASLTFHLPDR